MGEVIRLNPPRTLAHIIAEILLDEGRIVHTHDEAGFGILELRLSANKAEAKAMVESCTGISWEELAAALA